MTQATVSLQATISLLLLSAAIVSRCYAVPIPASNPTEMTTLPSPISPSTTTLSSSSCAVTPDGTVIHDSTCIQEMFYDAALKLAIHNYNNGLSVRQFVCKTGQTYYDVRTQPMLILQSLRDNVELLDRLEVSSINANYSDYICRMKATVIPSLNQTLTSICNCQTEGCDPNSLPSSSPSVNTDDTVSPSEWCMVETIQRKLREVLNRIVLDKHVIINSRTLQCQVNFTTRYLFKQMKDEVTALEEELRPAVGNSPHCPVVSPPTAIPANCILPLATVKQLPSLLGQNGLSSLAHDLETIIPEMESLLQSQNSNCSALDQPLPVMSEYCLIRLLKSNFLSLYNSLRQRLLVDDIQLKYEECSDTQEDMASEQGVKGSKIPLSKSEDPTSPSRWRSVTLPGRPS